MRGTLTIKHASNEPAGSCFVGTVGSGTLIKGMEALYERGVLTITRIETGVYVEVEKATRGQSVIVYCQPAIPSIESLIGKKLSFDDKRTIPLRKGIFLNPEIS